jgi:DNA-directed RNA polymerase beta' subunit
MRKQKDALKDKVMETIERMLEVRDDMVDNVFKGEMNSRVNMPVNIMRIIENVQKQLHIQGNSMVDITPLECYEAVEDCKKQLNMLGTCKPQRLFYALLDYYLSPNEMLMKYRFNKIAMKTLTTQIVSYYMKSIINPGEMVGIIAAQSIGEPTTQMSCISSEKMRIMKKHKVTGIVSSVHIPIGELCDEIITNNPEQTHNTGHEDSVETSLDNDQYEYYIVGVSSDEKTYWNKISHVSRHPVNGRLLEFKTRSGRSTITTASHSHLKRDVDTQKVVPIRGDKLELGMRIPVCKSLKDSERPISYKNTIDFYGNKSIELDAITKQPLGKFIGMILASLTQSNRKNEIDLLCPSKETYFDVKDIMDKATLPYTQNHSVESESEPDFEPLYNEIIINDADFVNYIKTTFYNKHNKLCVPEFMFEMDKECISGMLQALFDKCSYIQNSIRLFTNENVNMEMLYDIAFLLYEFDIFSVFRHQTENQKHGELSIPAKYGETFRTEIGTTHKFNTMSLSDMIVYQQKNKHTLREDIDLIPGVGHIIADIGHFLRMPNSAKNYGRWRSKPHIGRRTLKKYINNFESAILNNDVCKEEMDNLRQAAFSNVVWDEIIEIKEVDATQEKYVYDFTVPGNQTFMNDTGLIVHNTLNTFHSAGISSKSNVTRGVPRIEEILSLTKNPKNPSMTVHMKGDDVYDKQKAQQMKYILEYTSMRDIVDSVTICFDPDSLNTLIEEDKELVSQFMAFEKMTKEAADESISSEEKNASKWILRFELNKDSMLDRNITMDDVYFALKNGYKEEFHCIYSDYNADKLIMRIRFLEALKKSKTSIGYSSHKELDQSDYIYVLKNIQENLLDNVVLKGVHDIPNVNIRKLQNQIVKQDGDYVAKDKWVLDTVGSNLLGILGKDDIDATKTITNDIVEVRNILGVEAARQVIYNEFAEVIEFDGTYINYHHLSMLCDRMCCKHELVSIFRYGITNDDIGPIAKASFEQTPEMFLRAARHGEFDNMRGVSASVMTGQKGNFGTSSFQVVLDMEEMMKQEKKTLKKETTIEDMFELRDEEGEFCSVQNISKHDNVKLLKEANVGDLDDDYEMDF